LCPDVATHVIIVEEGKYERMDRELCVNLEYSHGDAISYASKNV